jgi:glycosyltransferase involved in cell wall biosynthesis
MSAAKHTETSNKILIHTIVFSPDGVSTAYIYNDIALKFKDSGYEVTVLTTTPHYNQVTEDMQLQPLKSRFWGLFYQSSFHGIKVLHVPQKKFKSSLLRMLGFIYWHFLSFFIALFQRKTDIILSPSPPLTLGVMNIVIAKIKGIKSIYNVQEIYPDLLIESGELRSGIITALLKKMELWVYRNSDAITTIDQVFYKTIAPRFSDRNKLSIIPNFVDTDIYHPTALKSTHIDRNFFPETKSLKLMYAGNIGHAQDWETLILLAIELKKEAVEFFVIGEGVLKDYLQTEKQKHQLDKVHLIPYQQRDLIPAINAYADLHFIFMSPQTEGHGFPSKVYTIMACARPLIVCSGYETPIVQFLENKNCAVLIQEREAAKRATLLAKELLSLKADTLITMGQNGLTEVEKRYTKEKVTSAYIDLANRLLASQK